MKNLKVKIYALFSLVLLLNCTSDFEKLNTDPNNPTQVPADLLLGTIQRIYLNNLHNVLGGAGGDMGAVWAQHWTKVQYNDEERYVPRRGVIDNIWNVHYASVISEAQSMFDLAVLEENTNLQGIALIMKASGFQFLTELYGPIPFTEALDATNLKPNYDDEATIYSGIIDMYTDGVNLLASGSGAITASSDLFYSGDTSNWIRLGNSLKFKALMRVSKAGIDGLDVSAQLQALVNGGNMFSSNDDEARLPYLAAQPDSHPIYEQIIYSNRPEYKVNSELVTRMEALRDPRLAVYASENDSGVILGKPSGYGNSTTLPNEGLGYTYANISGLGEFYLNPELPGILMSYAQLKFLMAEAANEGLISGGITNALMYYNEAITANFEFNGLAAVAAADYIAQPVIGFATQTDARTKIAEQQWLALFGQGFEAWTEWRRTKIPVLSPAIEGNINQIPSRYFYPTTESSLNADNYKSGAQSIGGDELTSSLHYHLWYS